MASLCVQLHFISSIGAFVIAPFNPIIEEDNPSGCPVNSWNNLDTVWVVTQTCSFDSFGQKRDNHSFMDMYNTHTMVDDICKFRVIVT